MSVHQCLVSGGVRRIQIAVLKITTPPFVGHVGGNVDGLGPFRGCLLCILGCLEAISETFLEGFGAILRVFEGHFMVFGGHFGGVWNQLGGFEAIYGGHWGCFGASFGCLRASSLALCNFAWWVGRC